MTVRPPTPGVGKTAYYTRRSQAQKVLPSDVRGARVQFAAGKGYYIGTAPPAAPTPLVRHPAAPAAADPFALSTPAQIQAQIAARTSGLPPVLTDQQLAARAQSQVDPLVAALAARIGAQAKAGAGAISGYTHQLQGQLGQYAGQAGQIYGQAQQSQAGSDAALSQMLSGQGSDLAANLGAKLQQAGMSQPVIDKTTGQAVQTGAGSAGALYGTGSASLSDLVSRGASAQDYAAKLPGIAGLGGLQQIGQLEHQSQAELADQTSQLQSQLPDIIAGLRSSNETARANRASTANDIWQYLTSRNDTLAGNNRTRADTLAANRQARKDALSLGTAKNAATVQAANTRAAATIAAANQRNQTTIALADGRNRTAISIAKVKADQQAANDAKPNATLSKGLGYLVDSTGNYIPDKNGNPRVLPGFKVQNGQIVKVAGGKGAGGVTADTKAGLKKDAAAAMDSYYYGSAPKQKYVTVTNADGTKTGKWIEVPGTGTAGLTYGKAIARIMAQYSLSKAEATALANNYYAPGEYGRPAPPAPKPHPDTGFRQAKI